MLKTKTITVASVRTNAVQPMSLSPAATADEENALPKCPTSASTDDKENLIGCASPASSSKKATKLSAVVPLPSSTSNEQPEKVPKPLLHRLKNLFIIHENPKVRRFYLKVFIAWFVWIFSATVVYAIRNDLGWARGFYMAVNVGYSIGWGFPLEKDHKIIWYSIFHVLVGASAVAASLGFFA